MYNFLNNLLFVLHITDNMFSLVTGYSIVCFLQYLIEHFFLKSYPMIFSFLVFYL
jgi:hypothetical protein